MRQVGLLGLIAALSLCLVPGVADAAKGKKKKPDRVGVMTYNLYLGSSLSDALFEATTPTAGAGHVDRFANEVGEILSEVNSNNFPLRAKQISRDIQKRKVDLVGLQEAALWNVQIPTDGGAPSPSNPSAIRAKLPVADYIQTLLKELNKKAKTKKQCADARKKAKATGKKVKPCYRGYNLVISQQEADIEFPADFDNNPGPDGIHGEGFGAAPPCAGGPPNQGGNDDTGFFLGDPNGALDLNGDTAGGCATAEAFSDCADTNPAAAGFGASIGVQPLHTCLFHGIDGDVSLTMRDAILARKGAGVKAKGAKGANFTNKLSVPALGTTLNFTRGWTSADASVRGKKFRFVNTHLESENNGTIREDQASELVAAGGPATAVPTVLVGDLNSDPASSNPEGPPAYNRLAAAGFRSLTGPALTSGHGELLSDTSNVLDNSRIDHILTNSTSITLFKSSVVDTFANGLWNSDHGGVYSSLNVPGGKKAKKK